MCHALLWTRLELSNILACPTSPALASMTLFHAKPAGCYICGKPAAVHPSWPPPGRDRGTDALPSRVQNAPCCLSLWAQVKHMSAWTDAGWAPCSYLATVLSACNHH